MRVAISHPKGRDVAVVDLVQSGIVLLLRCLNLSDVRSQLTPLGFAHGSATFPQMRELLSDLFDRQG